MYSAIMLLLFPVVVTYYFKMTYPFRWIVAFYWFNFIFFVGVFLGGCLAFMGYPHFYDGFQFIGGPSVVTKMVDSDRFTMLEMVLLVLPAAYIDYVRLVISLNTYHFSFLLIIPELIALNIIVVWINCGRAQKDFWFPPSKAKIEAEKKAEAKEANDRYQKTGEAHKFTREKDGFDGYEGWKPSYFNEPVPNWVKENAKEQAEEYKMRQKRGY